MYSRFPEISLLLAVITLCSCNRGEEGVQQSRPATASVLAIGNRQSTLVPGQSVAVRELQNPFEGNEEAIGEGKKLYNQFNCSGCHFQGGGGIGPALMDDVWVYGSSSANIYWTVIEGRPNGMPAFGGRIVDDQIWKIAAFVRSLSGLKKPHEKAVQHSLTLP